MEAIILAGGRGTRLSSVVPELPKPMAAVSGRPFLSWLLIRLRAQGIQRVCLSTGYMAETIESYYGGRFDGMELVYARETSPLGTGGAMRLALDRLNAENVFVFNGDTLATIELEKMWQQHIESSRALTVALSHVSDTSRYGVVVVHDDRIVGFNEKGKSGPGFINVGAYILRRDLLAAPDLPEAFSFEERILMARLETLAPGAFIASGYFIDIGVPEDYARAQDELPKVLETPGH